MKKQVLSLLVENNPGCANRISGLFSRRCFNIDSFCSGVTADPRYQRITIVSTGDDDDFEQLDKQLNKLEDVVDVKVLHHDAVIRELMLIKLRVSDAQRQAVMNITEIYHGKIVDVSKDSMIVELTGNQQKMEAFLGLLDGYEILELARTGVTGLTRGSSDVLIL